MPMFRVRIAVLPCNFLPWPETVLTDASSNVHATVHHPGVYICARFAYWKFPTHGDCATTSLCSGYRVGRLTGLEEVHID